MEYKLLEEKYLILMKDIVGDEEIGREFGLKILKYYNYPHKEIAVLKADLNDEYYPIEEILGEMYDKGYLE